MNSEKLQWYLPLIVSMMTGVLSVMLINSFLSEAITIWPAFTVFILAALLCVPFYWRVKRRFMYMHLISFPLAVMFFAYIGSGFRISIGDLITVAVTSSDVFLLSGIIVGFIYRIMYWWKIEQYTDPFTFRRPGLGKKKTADDDKPDNEA